MNSRYKRCLMILADGARADLLIDLVRRGMLPAIAEFLPHFREGVTAFPSTTGPAYMPYLTGCYPGTCNVPGIRWFDKEAYSNRPFSRRRYRSYVGAETFFITKDMEREVKTVFEILPRSFNIFNAISRGARRVHNPTWFFRIWYWYYAHLTDHWSLVDKAASEKVLRALEQDPEFLFVVFPGIDEHSHLSSPSHPEALKAYQEIDHFVGRLVKKLKQEGKWEETLVLIVSDHGLSETQTHFELDRFLEGLGLRTLSYPKILFRYRIDSALMVSGNGMAHVYLKNEEDWKGRTPWEEILTRKDRLVEKLLERPEVDLVAGQAADGSIVVKSRRGEAVVRRDQGEIFYRVHGSDPFGYPPLPREMTDRESLDRTFATDYPDAPAQLLQIFNSPRTGDLVVSAAKGFDLREQFEVPEHKSSHGSLHWEHMKIPVVSNVNLPERPIRSVDIFPTMLHLLGHNSPENIDGVNLIR